MLSDKDCFRRSRFLPENRRMVVLLSPGVNRFVDVECNFRSTGIVRSTVSRMKILRFVSEISIGEEVLPRCDIVYFYIIHIMGSVVKICNSIGVFDCSPMYWQCDGIVSGITDMILMDCTHRQWSVNAAVIIFPGVVVGGGISD